MSGLKRRLSRRRSAGPEGTEPPTAAAPGLEDAAPQTPVETEGHTSLLSDPAAATPAVQPEPAGYAPFTTGEPYPGAPYAVRDPAEPPAVPVADLPPGLDPDELSAVPSSSARRGRLRKRVAFLRAARELLLRDLGGFVYELHRTARDIEAEGHRQLRATKLDRLTRIDAELHALELQLDDVRRNVVVREPGVGGECPHCGELFGSDAHYCSHCGLPLTESARRALARAAEPAAAPEPAPVVAPVAAPIQPATADQPTQELPPLPLEPGTEFHWPRRDATSAPAAGEPGPETAAEAAAGGAETAAGGDAAGTAPATGAETDGDGAETTSGGDAAGSAPATGAETPGDAAGSTPATGVETPGDGAETTGGGDAAESAPATGAETPDGGSKTTAGGDAAASTPATDAAGSAPATGPETSGGGAETTPAADPAKSGDDADAATPGGDAAGSAPSSDEAPTRVIPGDGEPSADSPAAPEGLDLYSRRMGRRT